eukprot:5911463-Amphidinium_carterae.2
MAGLLVLPNGQHRYFSTTVRSDILSSWRNVAKQPIAHVDLFAYVLIRPSSLQVAGFWCSLTMTRFHALILARAESDSLVARLREVALADLHTPTLTWFYRCPSFSNPAKALSRDSLGFCVPAQASYVSVAAAAFASRLLMGCCEP